MEEYLQAGVFANTHGLKGEIKVFPTTDDPKRFQRLKEIILEKNQTRLTLTIENVRFLKNMVLLKFKGIDDINAIEKYKGAGLLVPRKDAIELRQGEYFIADLIGVSVVTDEEERLGFLTEVLQTGANDVYIVKSEAGEAKSEILLPAIKQCILDVDLERRVMRVHLLEGLREL